MQQREVLTIPARRYGPYTPLLMFGSGAAEERGARVHTMTWQRMDELKAIPFEKWGPWAHAQVATVLDDLAPAQPMLIAKSLGTHAARLAAERNLPAVWLTPLLTDDALVSGLKAANAPFMLIGGTEDTFWDGRVARALTPHVLEIEGANHGMYVPGPLARSAAVLGQVVTAVEEFLDAVVWPTR
jgi:hypothetical protein